MLIYEIAIRFFALGIRLAGPFSLKARKWVAGRRKWKEELSQFDFSRGEWVWFHYSSYGEFQDGKYLMELYRKQYGGYKILVSFFSSTGYELTRNYNGADHICYLPLDTGANAAFFIDRVKPSLAFFVRNDVWPNFVSALAERKIPVFLAIFAINTDSTFFKFPLAGFYRSIFRKFNCIFTQDEASCKALLDNRFGDNIITVGNSRIDRVIEIGRESFRDETIEKFVASDFCFIAGSTHIDDRKIFLETFKQLEAETIKWVIVPHEIDEQEKREAKELLGDKVVFYSEKEKLRADTKILWVDHVGMLAQMYRYTDIAFIGGGFDPGGIHSMIEPLVYGCPVCFGPENRAYKEVTDLIASGGAAVIHNSKDLSEFALKYFRNRELLKQTKEANKTYLLASGGASQRVLNYLAEEKYLQQ